MGGSSADDHASGSASRFSTLQNLVKPFIGAGILALPSAFKNGGVLASAILMAILAIGVNYCIRCLLTSVDYIYAREHRLEYDAATGKFSAGVDSAVGERTSPDALSINEESHTEDDCESVSTPLRGPKDPSGEDRRSKAAVTMVTRSPRGTRDPASSAVRSSNSRGGVHPSDSGASHVGFASKRPVPADFDPLTSQPMYSFRDVGEYAYGWKGCLAVDFNLIASQLGFCIAYVSFISQNMIKVTDVLTRVEWVLVLTGAWSLLVQIRDIRKISFTSMFGNVVYLTSLGIIFYDGFAHHCCVSAGDTAWVRASGLALVFGTGCFALEGIGLVLPVKRAMKDQHDFGSVLNMAIAFVVTLYILFGVLGYLFYGDAVESVITKNLTAGAMSDAVRISLSISLFFTYAIQMFPVAEIVDEVWDTRVFNQTTENTPIHGAATRNTISISSGSSIHRGSSSSPSDGTSSTTTYQALADQSTQTQSNTTALVVDPAYASFAAGSGVPIGVQDESALSSGGGSSSSAASRPTSGKRELALIGSRIGLVLFTAGVSIVFPNFGLIVSLVGSFSNSAIAFILPQIFFLRLVVDSDAHRTGSNSAPDWWTRWRAYLLPWTVVVLGCAASAIGVYTTVRDMITGDDS